MSMGCPCRPPVTIQRMKTGAQVSTVASVKFCPKCSARIVVIPIRGANNRTIYQYVPCGCGR